MLRKAKLYRVSIKIFCANSVDAFLLQWKFTQGQKKSSSKNVLASFTLKYRFVLCTKLLNELTSHMDHFVGAFWSLKAPNTRISEHDSDSTLSLYLNVQHQHCTKHLLLCSAEERKSYGFGTTWRWMYFQFWLNYSFKFNDLHVLYHWWSGMSD